MEAQWKLSQKSADFYGLSKNLGVSPFLVRLLVNRGVTNEGEMKAFLYGGLELLHSPLLLKGMGEAASLLEWALGEGGKVAIASDFDCDGIFASMVLYEGLRELGAEPVIYTPDRVTEGYGLNERIVDEAKEGGARILLTCDNGVAAFEPIRHAKEQGMKVVVTDHHELAFVTGEDGKREYRLPDADAIVNPKQPDCGYPFKGICGAAVAYKLMEVLYGRAGLGKERVRKLLAYVAIATIADVMDLRDENRIFVKYGLELLRKCDNIGLRALMETNGIEPDKLSARHVAFVMGPCFNAAGRLDTVEMAFRLLTSGDWDEAWEAANNLKALNERRKEMTERGFEAACETIVRDGLQADKVLLVPLTDCHESLAGIIAGRLREKYHKPSFAFVETRLGWKGSGRSMEAYHMFEELTACKDLLIRYGGHPMAAGLTLEKGNLEALRERLNQRTDLSEEDLTPTVKIDIDLPLRYADQALLTELDMLEPFGKGNPKPLFAERHFRIAGARYIGKESNYLKMKVRNEQGDEREALYFGDAKEFVDKLEEAYGKEEVERMFAWQSNQIDVALAYYPSLNDYKGRQTMQIMIQHYRIKAKGKGEGR